MTERLSRFVLLLYGDKLYSTTIFSRIQEEFPEVTEFSDDHGP